MTTAALHLDVAQAGRRPPDHFRIFPMGVVSSLKGEFLFDAAAAGMVMAAAQEHGVDFTIDYDHHTLAAGAGVQAIAAGWFNLDLRNDGLYAVNVRWTPKAESHLRTGEYRYFSPLFNWDDSSGRITSLINTALTNTPALHDLAALVAASAPITSSKGTTPTMRTPIRSSDDLAIKARIAHLAGTKMSTPATAALSAAAGTTSKRAALSQKTDAQLLAELTPERRGHMTRVYGSDPRIVGKWVRKEALNALDREDHEAGEALQEAGKVALSLQRGP
jgi:phage I-like protein